MYLNETNHILSGLCPECSEKLNYRSKKREIKRLKKSDKKKKRNKQEEDPESENVGSPAAPEVLEEPSTSTENVVESNDESLWKKGIKIVYF